MLLKNIINAQATTPNILRYGKGVLALFIGQQFFSNIG